MKDLPLNENLEIKKSEAEKCPAKLIVANKELNLQTKEKEKCAVELTAANKEIGYQNGEIENRSGKLNIAYRDLAFKAAELISANKKLIKAEENQKEYARGLEEMMFITSHKVREPVVDLLGFSNLLNCLNPTKEDLTKIAAYMKQSLLILDTITKELTLFIYDQKIKAKKENP